MKLQIQTRPYNERRYSKPWIARVDFASNPQGNFMWGYWVGDSRNGSEGLLEIDAEPGDIIARGQKDYRNMRHSAPDWYQLQQDGTLSGLTGKAAAISAFREQQAKVSQPAPLAAEEVPQEMCS